MTPVYHILIIVWAALISISFIGVWSSSKYHWGDFLIAIVVWSGLCSALAGLLYVCHFLWIHS